MQKCSVTEADWQSAYEKFIPHVYAVSFLQLLEVVGIIAGGFGIVARGVGIIAGSRLV